MEPEGLLPSSKYP